MASLLTEFMEILVGGITTLATGIATGVATMATNLFCEVSSGGEITGLSAFGGITAVFCGIALAVGVTSKVYMWVVSLGSR